MTQAITSRFVRSLSAALAVLMLTTATPAGAASTGPACTGVREGGCVQVPPVLRPKGSGKEKRTGTASPKYYRIDVVRRSVGREMTVLDVRMNGRDYRITASDSPNHGKTLGLSRGGRRIFAIETDPRGRVRTLDGRGTPIDERAARRAFTRRDREATAVLLSPPVVSRVFREHDTSIDTIGIEQGCGGPWGEVACGKWWPEIEWGCSGEIGSEVEDSFECWISAKWDW